MHILLVEDDDIDAKLIEIYCRAIPSVSITMDRATSTAEARRMLYAKTYDACVFDFWLNSHNSGTLASDLARVKSDLPTVVLSGMDQSFLDEEGLRQDEIIFLHKIELCSQSLISALEKAVQRKEFQKSQPIPESSTRFFTPATTIELQ